MKNTKIDLSFPYSEDYKAGYKNTNKEPRQIVVLVRKDGTKTSTSYARYLMSCSLGRYLTDEEVVDHIDDNKLNDCLSNYQIITTQENNAKGKSRTYKTFTCPVCNKEFTKEARNVNFKLKQGKIITCSRSCGGKWSHK
jgi:hypothetical protein